MVNGYVAITLSENVRISKTDVTNRLMDVRWNDETLSWELTDVGTPAFEINHIFNTIDLTELEVESCYGERISFIVGNIYDDPELLK